MPGPKNSANRLAFVILQFLYPYSTNLWTKLRSAAILAGISCAISALDIATGRDVTVRPLLAAMVVLTGFLEERILGFAFSAFSALLFTAAFAISQESYSFLSLSVNFLSAFLAYALLAETSLLAITSISKLSKMLLEAQVEINRLTETNEHREKKS